MYHQERLEAHEAAWGACSETPHEGFCELDFK
jgi:hypothetical protein